MQVRKLWLNGSCGDVIVFDDDAMWYFHRAHTNDREILFFCAETVRSLPMDCPRTCVCGGQQLSDQWASVCSRRSLA